jgi:hypothetical protein
MRRAAFITASVRNRYGTSLEWDRESTWRKSANMFFDGNFGLPGASVNVLRAAAARCTEEKYPRWKDTFLYLQMQDDIVYATEDAIRRESKKQIDKRDRYDLISYTNFKRESSVRQLAEGSRSRTYPARSDRANWI